MGSGMGRINVRAWGSAPRVVSADAAAQSCVYLMIRPQLVHQVRW